MNKDIRLIAADIDGTIVPVREDPAAFTIETIERIMDAGILFGPASGRPIDDIIDRYKEWGLSRQFDFIIGWNGSELYDNETKQRYRYNFLKKEWIREIIDFMSQFPAYISIYLPGIYLSSAEHEKGVLSAYRTHRRFVLAQNISEFYAQDNGGIMFRYDPKLTPVIKEKLSALKDKEYVGFNTQPDLLEFSHRDSSKGFALARLCELKGIDLKQCCSFGDTSNDESMFKISNGICMCDGNPESIAKAACITDYSCRDDGFARYVREHIL